MFVVAGAAVPGAIPGPTGAGDGGGSSGTALTGPMPNVNAAMPTPAAMDAALAEREIPMVSFLCDLLCVALIGSLRSDAELALATPRRHAVRTNTQFDGSTHLLRGRKNLPNDGGSYRSAEPTDVL